MQPWTFDVKAILDLYATTPRSTAIVPAVLAERFWASASKDFERGKYASMVDAFLLLKEMVCAENSTLKLTFMDGMHYSSKECPDGHQLRQEGRVPVHLQNLKLWGGERDALDAMHLQQLVNVANAPITFEGYFCSHCGKVVQARETTSTTWNDRAFFCTGRAVALGDGQFKRHEGVVQLTFFFHGIEVTI